MSQIKLVLKLAQEKIQTFVASNQSGFWKHFSSHLLKEFTYAQLNSFVIFTLPVESVDTQYIIVSLPVDYNIGHIDLNSYHRLSIARL